MREPKYAAVVLSVLAGCASVRSTSPVPAVEGSAGDARASPLQSPAQEPSAPVAAVSEPSSTSDSARPAAANELVWETGAGKSYWIPAFDIVGFLLLLNLFDRNFVEEGTYDSSFSTFESNLQSGWVIDRDPFATNQFLHPYQGSMYHGFGRSAGLNYWEALGYDFAGSALWETAGETDPPSLNDQITTSFGGSFLGEALFRMANMVLEDGGESPGFGHRLGAGLISPAMGFNRLAFGDRFDAIYPSHDPATFWQVGVGGRRNATLDDAGSLSNLNRDGAVADFTLEYGLPGKSGYTYDRPFDYFHFEATLTSSSDALPENVMARGLLWGADYESGDSYRGIWGLYGSYDYMSPEIFSISATTVSLGTTGQMWLSEDVALQGTAMGGVGWTAVGTIADAEEDRDYVYGYSPAALIGLRFIFGDRVMLDMSVRDYLVSGTSSADSHGEENILRAQAALTVRVYEHHALGMQFVTTRRDSSFSDISETLQTVGALSVTYTYLSDTKFGAVKW